MDVNLNHVEPEDTRPQCPHCNATIEGDGVTHCSFRCWHLDNLGEVKAQILCWLKIWNDDNRVIRMLSIGGDDSWFGGMTDSTEKRWKAAITTRFNYVQKITELDSHNDY